MKNRLQQITEDIQPDEQAEPEQSKPEQSKIYSKDELNRIINEKLSEAEKLFRMDAQQKAEYERIQLDKNSQNVKKLLPKEN